MREATGREGQTFIPVPEARAKRLAYSTAGRRRATTGGGLPFVDYSCERAHQRLRVALAMKAGIGVLWMLVVVSVAGAGALVASYVMWRASNRSGLWSLIAGLVLGLVAFGCAISIGLAITRAWFRN